MGRTRKLAVALVLLAVAAALVWGFVPKPVAVDTAGVTRGPMRVTVDEEGKTRVKDRFVVSAPVAGYARRIDLDVGDAVASGDVVASIEPARATVLDPRTLAAARARVAAAGSALKVALEESEAAGAEAAFAASELARVRGLFEGGYVPRERLDAAEADRRRTGALLRSANFNADVARFTLAAARTALRYSGGESDGGRASRTVELRAPTDGVVLRVIHESEGAVPVGEPLIEIGDPAGLEVEVDVLSADSVRIAPGAPVEFIRWGGDKPLAGRVRVVEPAGFTKVSALGVEEQRVLVISEITSPTEMWKRLGDGYRVEASFILWEGESVLQVPSSALFRYRGGWALFVIDGGRARLRTVETGRRSGLVAEVRGGVAEGDVVIVHPDGSIEDSTRVRPRRARR
ncbi:MAG: efflux RND transporter periplasmic adaptor subunit [Thermodesulfobacteriota bacterium]